MPFAYRISLAAALFVAGCATAPPPTSTAETLREDLPLLLKDHASVTELLDAVVVGSAIVAVGDGGVIIRSTESGKTWEKSNSPTQTTLTGVSFAPDGLHGWAVGHDCLILATTDGGLTWQKQWQGGDLNAWFLDVFAVSETRAIAVGKDGLDVETSDGGVSWRLRLHLDEPAYSITRISRGEWDTLYFAGEHGAAFRSRDDGRTWVRLPVPTTSNLYGILPLGSGRLLAYGGNMEGKIFRSDDDGDSWSTLKIARRNLLLKTGLILRDGSILLTGVSGDWREDAFHGFFLSRDGGHTFVPWPLAPKLPKNSPDWSTKLALNEILQAPDGSFIFFGPAGATNLGR